ncbi:hypothetical protein JHK85_056891 [Glycine max]|nr:hypothetical protein JHK85_056891 [Glycine max]
MENDTAAAVNNNTTATATAKAGSGGVKSNNHNLEEEHSNLNGEEHMAEQVEAEEEEDREADDGEGEQTGSRQPSRTPFTNLSQVDADLALARTLQEQLPKDMQIPGVDIPDPRCWSFTNSYVFSSDEAYARALQEAEEREMAARLLAFAGINDREEEDIEEHGANSQEWPSRPLSRWCGVALSRSVLWFRNCDLDFEDAWEDVDPDELSYEELLALGEAVGTESRGLSTDTIACLPSVNYKTGSDQHGSNDSCVICRVDYEDDESLTVLSCKHLYHPECINNWLKINKVVVLVYSSIRSLIHAPVCIWLDNAFVS